MRELFTNQLFEIAPGHAVSGIAKRAQSLRVVSGKVWLTVEGIDHDYWLSAGDTFTAIPGRLIVVEADKIASRVDFRRPQTGLALQGAGAWLAGYVQRLLGRATVQASLKQNRACSDAGC